VGACCMQTPCFGCMLLLVNAGDRQECLGETGHAGSYKGRQVLQVALAAVGAASAVRLQTSPIVPTRSGSGAAMAAAMVAVGAGYQLQTNAARSSSGAAVSGSSGRNGSNGSSVAELVDRLQSERQIASWQHWLSLGSLIYCTPCMRACLHAHVQSDQRADCVAAD
jgi:hypothetical protein